MYLTDTTNRFSNSILTGTATYSATPANTANFQLSGSYGAVNMEDGRVFCIPSFDLTNYANLSLTYNPYLILNPGTSNMENRWSGEYLNSTGWYNATQAGGESPHAFDGAVLMDNGWVFMVPHNSAKYAIYGPSINDMVSYSTIPTLWTVSGYNNIGNFKGGVLLPDNRVLCIPHNSNQFLIYNRYDPNVVAGAGFTTLNSLVTGVSGSFSNGVLMPNGLVLTVPYNSTSAIVFNYANNSQTVLSEVFTGNKAYIGGVLMQDGRVFLVPHNATAAKIYNPVTSTFAAASGVYPGNQAFSGGVLMPNGNIFLVPYKYNRAVIYNPTTNAITTLNENFTGYQSNGGLLTKTGHVFLVPGVYKDAKYFLYSPYNNYIASGDLNLDINFITSPYYNKA